MTVRLFGWASLLLSDSVNLTQILQLFPLSAGRYRRVEQRIAGGLVLASIYRVLRRIRTSCERNEKRQPTSS